MESPSSRKLGGTAKAFKKGSSLTDQEKGYSKAKPPELNLVTNFSKPPVLAQRAANAGREKSYWLQPDKGETHRGTHVTFATTKPLQESLGNTKPRSEQKKNYRDGMKGPIGSLKRSASRANELSPSDRTLVIGISVPSSKLADIEKSPENTPRETLGARTQQSITTFNPPATPNIVVTPAKPDSLWPLQPDESRTHDRRRPTSSVYSQATNFARGMSIVGDVPPLPNRPPILPPTHDHREHTNLKGDQERDSRVTSWSTAFDEDDGSPTGSHGRPNSGESQLAILKRSSLDTLATRRRSQGWWNQILSPFFPRPNTLFPRESPTDEKDTPALSNATQTKDVQENQANASPHANDRSRLRESNRTSIWTDVGSWDGQRKSHVDPLEKSAGADRGLGSSPATSLSSTPEDPTPAGIGAAAEYFEACWHDQNSPTPFFECQNHTCLPPDQAKPDTNDPTPNDKNSYTDDKEPRQNIHYNTFVIPQTNKAPIESYGRYEKGDFHQAPTNRFSAAFREATARKTRPFSDATDIEEDPDTTPEVQEARAAPMVRSRSPVPTIQPAPSDSREDEQPNPNMKEAERELPVDSQPSQLRSKDESNQSMLRPRNPMPGTWPSSFNQKPDTQQEPANTGKGPGSNLQSSREYSEDVSVPDEQLHQDLGKFQQSIRSSRQLSRDDPMSNSRQESVDSQKALASSSNAPDQDSESKPIGDIVNRSLKNESPSSRAPSRQDRQGSPRPVGLIKAKGPRRGPVADQNMSHEATTDGPAPKELPRGNGESQRYSDPSAPSLPRDSPALSEKPTKRYVAVMPPGRREELGGHPLSPGPQTPGPNQDKRSRNMIAMAKIPKESQQGASQDPYYGNQAFRTRDGWNEEPVDSKGQKPAPKQTYGIKEKMGIKEETKTKEKTKKSESKGCVKLKDCFSRKKPKSKKQKWLCIAIFIALLLMVTLILVLAMTLTRKGDTMPVQAQWLNLTGYPPIPTGISTVAQPNAVQEISGCVGPATMWSCAVPKEEQSSIAPNQPDQPNFRLEIRFENGTATNTTAQNSSDISRRSKNIQPNPVSAGSFIRTRILRIRDTLSDLLFTPSPSPPSQQDQVFLGNTTDNNTAPFDGESTPFFISFLDTTPTPSKRLVRRAQANSTNTTDPFPDLTSGIPAPDLNPDGTAAPANLVPLPSAQPLRLFDRGKVSEHYGFYNYFDRAIFLRSTALIDTNGTSVSEVPADENGGSEEDAATVRCTWAQTRFLVQIWTNLGSSAELLPSSNGSLPTPTSSISSKATATPGSNTSASANDFSRPGSFPYPVTITLDRHGGNIETKMIYCYGLDDREHVLTQEKKIQLEDRSFQGKLVNPAQGPFGHVNVSTSDGGPGGIDGGSGGCLCRWQNFQ
ncbi:hypothetical protein MMC20_001374 [Loxospora ochrophaea]|nr:hypothetical protein [Loxospora ochrophaea]